jgi:hypothetical protein
VIRWAIGAEQLTPEPPARDRRLLVLPAGQPVAGARPVHDRCLGATAFLPAPSPDGRIFFLVGGQVYARSAPGGEPAPLGGNDPALGVTRLLAFAKHASPLEMLVAAKPQGAAGEQLWRLTLEERAIQAARAVGGDRVLADQDAFFAAYHAPRCLEGGKRCLVPFGDGEAHYLDVEPTRGAPPERFVTLGPSPALDAAWASPDGGSIYLLLPCPA